MDVKMKNLILRECTNNNVIYGVITIKSDIHVNDFQEKIYEIKNSFYESDFEDWTIEDVLEELAKTYDFEYNQLDGNLEV